MLSSSDSVNRISSLAVFHTAIYRTRPTWTVSFFNSSDAALSINLPLVKERRSSINWITPPLMFIKSHNNYQNNHTKQCWNSEYVISSEAKWTTRSADLIRSDDSTHTVFRILAGFNSYTPQLILQHSLKDMHFMFSDFSTPSLHNTTFSWAAVMFWGFKTFLPARSLRLILCLLHSVT